MFILSKGTHTSHAKGTHTSHGKQTVKNLVDKLFQAVKMPKLVAAANRSKMCLLDMLHFVLETSGLARKSTLNQMFLSDIAANLCFSKASFYNAVKSCDIDWRALLSGLALQVAMEVFRGAPYLWFVVDDTIVTRDKSKKVEKMAPVHDHNDGTNHQGFVVLVLGLTDGTTIIPIKFAVLSSPTGKEYEDESRKDKLPKLTTKAGKTRKQANTPKMDVLIQMLHEAMPLTEKLPIQGLLADSWFSAPAQVERITSLGLTMVTMLKSNDTRYTTVEGDVITVEQKLAALKQQIKEGQHFGEIAEEYQVVQGASTKLSAKIVFARNWKEDSASKPYIPLLCTDCDMTGRMIQRSYKKRWQIEVMFKQLKDKLALQDSCRSRIFESTVATMSIAFIRYTMIKLAQHMFFPGKSFSFVLNRFKVMALYTRTTDDLWTALHETTEGMSACLTQPVEEALDICFTNASLKEKRLFMALFKALFKAKAIERIEAAIGLISSQSRDMLISLLKQKSIFGKSDF